MKVSTRHVPLRNRLGSVYLSFLGIAASHGTAQAFEPTTSGTLLRQNADLTRGIGADSNADRPSAIPPPAPPPATSADDELSFVVNTFDFGGALSEAEQQRVDAFVAPWQGRRVTLAQLQSLRDALMAVLYNGGDALVRVVLPPQTITAGVVRFEVERGHVEAVAVDNDSRVSTARLKDILTDTAQTAPTLREIERNARVVEGIPGVGTVSSTLSTGTTPGGTIVNVDVKPADRFVGAATIDNAGSQQAGWRRLGLSGAVNNPLGLGDQLLATVYTTPRFMQTRAGEDGRTRLGRLSYDLLTGLGASRAGVAYAHVDYRLGGDFAGLGDGSADVVSLYGTYPAIRASNASLDLGASLEGRRSNDARFDNVLQSRQNSLVASLRADGGFSGALGGNRNLVQYGVVASRGTTKLKEFDYSGANLSLAGRTFNFFKVEPTTTYVQSVTPSTQIMLTAHGQWASHTLDGSQRLGLGGPSAVRAYDQNAAAVDDGIIVSVSASMFIPKLPGTAVQIFYDDAHGRTRADGSLPGANAHLQGYGVGASYSGKHIAAQLSYAMRVGQGMENTARHQTWVSLTTTF